MTLPRQNYERLVDAWIKYTRLGYDSPFIGNYEWAFDAVEDLISADPHEALSLIKAILQQSDDEFLVANLAAGPLETLLSRHGFAVIEEIEEEALSNSRFKHLLGGVWKGAMPDNVWERFQKIERPTW